MNVASPRFTGPRTTKTTPEIKKQVDQLVENKTLPANATVNPEDLAQGLEERCPDGNFEVYMLSNTYYFRRLSESDLPSNDLEKRSPQENSPVDSTPTKNHVPDTSKSERQKAKKNWLNRLLNRN